MNPSPRPARRRTAWCRGRTAPTSCPRDTPPAPASSRTAMPLYAMFGPRPAHLVGVHQARAVVHRHPRLDARRGRAELARLARRQLGEVGVVGLRVLRRVVRLQVRLAEVVDHVVLLPRHHPRLRGHQAVAVRERAVQAVRVAAVLERVGGELRRRGQRAGLVLRAVAVGAHAGVDRLAPLERLVVQRADQAGVVDVLLVLREDERGLRRAQFLRPRRPALGDFDQVLRQVEELLAVRERVHQPVGHQRLRAGRPFVDVGRRDRRPASRRAGSRSVSVPFFSSASSPVTVRPSVVLTVSVSYPFLMTFDGEQHGLDRGTRRSPPCRPWRCPGRVACRSSASWHLAHVRNGWKNSTAPRPASPRSRAAFARSAGDSFSSCCASVGGAGRGSRCRPRPATACRAARACPGRASSARRG